MNDDLKKQMKTDINTESINTDESAPVQEIENISSDNTTDSGISLNPQKDIDDEIVKLRDSYMRLLAEIVNLRKNLDQEKQNAKQSLLLKFIAILDTYTVVAANNASSSENDSEYKMNFNNMLQQLEILLATENVKKIDIKVGDKFNPETAEAISTQEGDEDGKIVAIISPAYEMNNRVIKTAKIVVSKKM